MTDTTILKDKKRWNLAITYRCEVGPMVVDYDIEEISEAEGIVDRGPDWNTILDISIQLNRVSEDGPTLQSPLQEI
jgi:hypothetical protein